LNRVWNLVESEYVEKAILPADEKEIKHFSHKTIKKVTEDMERFHFNTMLAALMEYTNFLYKVHDSGSVTIDSWKDAIKILLLLIAPSAPHFAEELWFTRKYQYSIHNQMWPNWDGNLAKDEEVTLVIQVNGKLRDKVTVQVSISEEEASKTALNQERIKSYVSGKDIAKIIYIPDRLINIVIK
jgi:leucyl-tRNA synthetase